FVALFLPHEPTFGHLSFVNRPPSMCQQVGRHVLLLCRDKGPRPGTLLARARAVFGVTKFPSPKVGKITAKSPRSQARRVRLQLVACAGKSFCSAWLSGSARGSFINVAPLSQRRKYSKPSSEQPPWITYAAPHRSQVYASLR